MRDAKVSLEDIPLNSFHKKLTFYSAGGPFLDGYVLSILGVVMLQLTHDLQLSLAWQGLIAASALIGVFIGGFFGGWFTDKYGRKVLYLVDLIAIVGFSVAQFWVESAWALFAWRLLLGIAVGADYPIATAFLAEFLPRKNRGPRLSAMVVMWFVGAATAYIVGELIMRSGVEDAWRYVLASSIVPGIIFLVARTGTPESPRWLLNKGRVEEADQVIKKIYGSEYSIKDLSEDHIEEEAKVSLSELFHSGYGKRMWFINIFWTCAIIPLFAIYAFVPQVLEALKLTGDMAAWGSVAITMFFLVGSIIATLVIDKMGRKRMLFHSFLWSGVMLVLLGLFPDSSSTVVLLLFGGYAIFIGGAQVLEYVLPNELFPTEVRATAVGIGTSVSRIGAAIGTYLLPFALNDWGVGVTMIVAGFICFIGAWSALALAPNVDSMDLAAAARIQRVKA